VGIPLEQCEFLLAGKKITDYNATPMGLGLEHKDVKNVVLKVPFIIQNYNQASGDVRSGNAFHGKGDNPTLKSL
jgi:hypothetical protein